MDTRVSLKMQREALFIVETSFFFHVLLFTSRRETREVCEFMCRLTRMVAKRNINLNGTKLINYNHSPKKNNQETITNES
jgi:hypothetical protein